MKQINEVFSRKKHPVRFLQIGEGNFLRAFVDYGIDVANEELGFDSDVVIVIPRKARKGHDKRAVFRKQDNLFTVCLRGKKNGKPYKENRVVTCIDRVLSAYDDYDAFMELAKLDTLEYVVSNTTEAGIVFVDTDKFTDEPPEHYPAKLTKFLYARWKHFKGSKESALTMLPVELIDHNGEALKKCVLRYADLWELDDKFKAWVNDVCIFASTLVDRIVPGYPRDDAEKICVELGYEDALLDQGEPFGLWVIGDTGLKDKLNISTDKLSVEFADKIEVYKERKVRILNGAHTSMVLGAYLAGLDYVGQCMNDEAVRRQLDQSVFGEIVPTVHLSKEKAEAFARAVFERFENPFVKHALLSISLNSISKWRARVLPSLKDSLSNTGHLPKWLTYSFAALLAFYRTTKAGDGCLIGSRGTNEYEIHDDADKLGFIKEHAGLSTPEYVKSVMKQKEWWGEDLTAIPGFYDAVEKHLENIEKSGAKAYIEELGRE